MPMPPVLPTIDWRSVFESGQTWEDWLKSAESQENRETMERLLREQRLEKHLEGMLQALPKPVHVVAIAEDWCGDVVRHAPVLQRIAQGAPNLKVRFVKREQHKDVFVRFLTNGGEAIPRFVFLSDEWIECGNWGPMPSDCRRVMSRGKACNDLGAARKKVGGMYEADADKRIVVSELMDLIDIAASTAP